MLASLVTSERNRGESINLAQMTSMADWAYYRLEYSLVIVANWRTRALSAQLARLRELLEKAGSSFKIQRYPLV